MKRIITITLGMLLAGFIYAQSEETRSLSSFSRVSASEGINVYLKKGSTEEARIVSQNIDIDEVRTDVSGGRLKIHLDDGDWFNRSRRNVDVDVYVTFKEIDAISASSAASIIAEDELVTSGDFDVDVSSAGDIQASIKADDVEIDASSAGDAELTIEADEIEVDVSSSGDVEVEGKVRAVDAEASSSGDFDGYDLVAEEAEASASSGGSIKLNATNRVRARASSGGSVRYKGDPKYVDVSSSSGGSIKRY
jgi:hypothetical protein